MNGSVTKIWFCKAMSKKRGWQVTTSPPVPSENRFYCYTGLETSNAVCETTHRTRSPRFHGVTLFGPLVELNGLIFWSVGQFLDVTIPQSLIVKLEPRLVPSCLHHTEWYFIDNYVWVIKVKECLIGLELWVWVF